jgi:hypothetical protein
MVLLLAFGLIAGPEAVERTPAMAAVILMRMLVGAGSNGDHRWAPPALGGATDMSKVSQIDLASLPEGFRLQRLIFVAARKAFASLRGSFRATNTC